MSFGYSVGDLLTVLKLANEVRERFKDAPTQFQAISEDVQRLSSVLQDIEDNEPPDSLNDGQMRSFSRTFRACQDVLNDLNKTLDKYQEVISSTSGIKGLSRRVWKRLAWNQEEINDFRRRIDVNVNAFNLLLTSISRQIIDDTRSLVVSTNERLDQVVKHRNKEEQQDIMKWLSPITHAARQADVLGSRQSGTGKWFLDTDEFKQWVTQDQNTSVLMRTCFCPGIPGAGKTVLTSIVVDELHSRAKLDKTIGVAYYYCNYREKTTVKSILAALLRQLLEEQPFTPVALKTIYDVHRRQETKPTIDEILGQLDSTISSLSKKFIIIDALDECQLPGGLRMDLTKLISEISNLQSKHNLGLLATSRDNPDIAEIFEENIRLRIRADEGDIMRFLEGQLGSLPRCVQKSNSLQREIILKIARAVDGMFLLATLHLDSLRSKMFPKEIRDSLERLPTGLDAAYKEAMNRIEDQHPDRVRTAKQVLSFIACATRPLSQLELRHALAVEIGKVCLDEEYLPDIDDLVSVCAGLVSLDEQSDIIRLAHYTTQEFFEKTWMDFFPDAHYHLATTCISYLCFDAFQSDFSASVEQFESRLRLYPFYAYSAENWGHHARKSYSKVKKLVTEFLQTECPLVNSLQVLFSNRELPVYHRRIWRRVSPIHPAAYFGLNESIIQLLGHVVTCDIKDEHGQTALHWAARNTQTSTAELLLQKGSDVNSEDNEGRTVLHQATFKDDAQLIQLLLAYGADIEHENLNGQRPLLAAFENMSFLSQRLLDLRAAASAVNHMHCNPLHLAAIAGERDSIQMTDLLLSRGGFPTALDVENMAPVHYAVIAGSLVIAESLLRERVEINAGFERRHGAAEMEAGRTVYTLVPTQRKLSSPLHFAALIGHPTMTEFFLSKGANPNARCQNGDTPLHLALRTDTLCRADNETPQSKFAHRFLSSFWEHPDGWSDSRWKIEVLRDMIDDYEGDDAKEVDRTITETRAAVIDILLAHARTDVDLQNVHVQSPLHLVPYGKPDSMVFFLKLMGKKPNISAPDKKGRTPLHLASHAGDIEIVRCLLAAGASATALDSNGLDPLHYAVKSNSCSVVELILQYCNALGLNPCHQRDNGRQSLLHHHVESVICSAEMIRILLSHGADADEIDARGNTPLSLYLRNFHFEDRTPVCRLLLEEGANPLRRDPTGQNLAHLSMHYSAAEDQTLSTLQDFGVDITAKDIDNRGILHHGAIHGSLNHRIVDFLQENHALRLDDRDNYGRVPLSYAEETANQPRHPDCFGAGRWELTAKVLKQASLK